MPAPTRVYWYAPQLRPPAFGGMPRTPEPLPVIQRQFPGQRFAAWAYAEKLPADVVEHFTLELVQVQEGIPRDDKPARPVTPQIPAPAGCTPLGLTPVPAAVLQDLESAARRPTPRFDLAHRQEELF